MGKPKTCEKCGNILDARCPFCSDGYDLQFSADGKQSVKEVCSFCNGTNRVSHQAILDYRRDLMRYIDGLGKGEDGEAK
jgi:hypothetical protein